MENIPNIKEIYTGIQHQLCILIPEKWESIHLYASVIKQLNNLETWEMYFYYTPKSVLKKNAINVYEIPSRFNVDEDQYLELVDNLCNTIKRLYKEYKKTYDKSWSNIVITIKDSQFLIEYNDDNLLKSKYSSQDRHIIFKYKYLNIPLQSFNKKERKIIQEYLNNDEYKVICDRYFEYIPKEYVHNYIEYEKDDEQEENIYSSQLVSTEEKNFSFLEFLIKIFKRKHAKAVKKLVEPIIEPVLEPRIQILNNK